jgi:hypothetical protein
MNTTHFSEKNIATTKNFINKLRDVQEQCFSDLLGELNLNTTGEEFLFDYIYNCDSEVPSFENYLKEFNKTINDLTETEGYYSPSVTLLSTPMDHMSSNEAELETTFASPFDSSEIHLNSDILFSPLSSSVICDSY